MAARTCLLCGKALSRIWADKGEEFCSREHRNQYRLRRGMDRLLEANAVASVMRRREIPKQIPAGDLRAPGPASPRAFLTALRRPPAELAVRSPRLQGRPKLIGATRYMRSSPIAGETAEARELPAAARFAGPARRAPRIALRLPAHVMPAPPAAERPRTGAPAKPREDPIRWKGAGKPVIAAMLARAASARSSATMPQSRPARPMAASSLGRALRVSTSAGFRLPERAFPTTHFAAPEVHGLPHPSARRTVVATAPAGVQAGAREIEIAPAAMRIPPPPGPGFERRFRWPGPFEIHLEFRNAANGARPAAVPFGPPEDSAKERK